MSGNADQRENLKESINKQYLLADTATERGEYMSNLISKPKSLGN